jgi:hypothetical protein
MRLVSQKFRYVLARTSEIPISIGSLVDDVKGRESADYLGGGGMNSIFFMRPELINLGLSVVFVQDNVQLASERAKLRCFDFRGDTSLSPT